MSDLVCVTGAAGFVGSYVVKELLAQGYRVRATVRDPADKKKIAHLETFDGACARLELFKADLEKPGAFEQAVDGVKYVVHTASAVTLNAKDPQREIVDVAVNGTKNVVGAALASGSVSRIVVTSSVAAVVGDDKADDYRFSERDWNETATLKSDAYATSKVQAERAARALVQGKDVRFIAMLPALILGPVLTEAHLRTSPVILNELLSGKFPGVPNLYFGVIDVRDVAAAHVAALGAPDPADRYLCSTEVMGLREMATILRETVPTGKTPKLPLPNILMYATALFDKRLTFGFLRQNLNRAPTLDNRRLREELGVQLRPVRETVADTARSIANLTPLTQ
jgi:dihydroflavonol-4-reductase